MARPSKFNAATAKAILDAVRSGVTETAAAEHVGIHRDTLTSWKRLGESGDARYSAFVDDLTRARAEAEIRLTTVVTDAAFTEGDWKAALEVLARRNPEEWGRKDVVESRVDKKVQDLLETIRGQVSDDAFRQLAIAVCGERGLDPADVLGEDGATGSTSH